MRWRQNLILRRMHGEQVEVPKMEEELLIEPAIAQPALDSADVPVVADTLAPLFEPPMDTVTPDSTR